MSSLPPFRLPGLTVPRIAPGRVCEKAVPLLTWMLLMTLPVPSGMKVALQMCVLSLPLSSGSALIAAFLPALLRR